MDQVPGLQPGCQYTLQLGASWDHLPTEVVHAVQYDFKPASIDPSQPGQMKIDDKNGVSVQLPHRDTDETSEFKGHKKPVSKECFLVVNHKTKTVTLEKISNTIRLKRSRTAKKARPLIRREEDRVSPIPSQLTSNTISPQQPLRPHTPQPTAPLVSTPTPPKPAPQPTPPSIKQPIELAKKIKPEIKRASTSPPKRLKTGVMPSSGTLSSSESGSDSNSSDDSSSSDTEQPNFVKTETSATSDLFGSSDMFKEVFNKPIVEEPIVEKLKQEVPTEELNPLDMLSQDLDLSDSDDSD